ncbi:MAG TPA: hypothetical protein VGX28_16990 [Frankiaceae bacterium]|jgi:hypothetical protein|nr:hypothetical protein [Frankiaceae bacterium]
MLKRLSTVAAATAAGVVLFGAPAHATTPTTDCHGTTLTDPAGDQYIGLTTPGPRLAPTAAIDITSIFLTGAPGTEKLNIQVSDLSAPSTNTSYTFRWNDASSPLGGVYWELQASFDGTDAAGNGTYTLWRNTSSGFTLWGTTGRTFLGVNGVVQIDLRFDVTSWPTTLRGIQATAGQSEGYFWEPGLPPVSLPTIRSDEASAPDWTQPC